MTRAAHAPGRSPPGRKGSPPLRQRQHLIDACISALHVHGPSRTTVEKVVAIADMSPGIVRFYFDSKAAMLVAALQFLATEFEQRVLAPVGALAHRPVEALQLMLDLFLDPDIASARKVSVWYAFWGEASSRHEYYDICGHIDERFALLVHQLIGALVADVRQPQLDVDGIALGLIGVLEILWQDIAFQAERDVDRARARRRGMAYLRSVFPGCFEAPGAAAGAPGAAAGASATGAPRFGGWVYCNPGIFAREHDAVFRDAWLFVGHESQIPRAGDFLTDTGVERALVLRDASGGVGALRNSCPELPHALLTAEAGHLAAAIECRRHGLRFAPDGRSALEGGTDLTRLDLEAVQGLMFVRSPGGAGRGGAGQAGVVHAGAGQAQVGLAGAALRGAMAEPLLLLGTPSQTAVAADWKVVVELWLDAVVGSEWEVSPAGWSAALYLALLSGVPSQAWRRHYLWPNQLIETRPDGMSVIQAMPVAPGRCRVRRFDYTRLAPGAEARAASYLARRLGAQTRRSSTALAESIQQGLSDLGYAAAAAVSPAVIGFRDRLSAAVPALRAERPPGS